VNNEALKALETLFEDDIRRALNVLGLGDIPKDMQKESANPNVNYKERVENLIRSLESFIVQMAMEKEELGSLEETNRLRYECVGILLAIREIRINFPEIY